MEHGCWVCALHEALVRITAEAAVTLVQRSHPVLAHVVAASPWVLWLVVVVWHVHLYATHFRRGGVAAPVAPLGGQQPGQAGFRAPEMLGPNGERLVALASPEWRITSWVPAPTQSADEPRVVR